MAFLLMSAAFRAMDPALEESAMMSGASVHPGRLARSRCGCRGPRSFATMLILFVRALESFEVPALLGLPAGIQVFTSSIYQAMHRYPSRHRPRVGVCVTLLAITGRRHLWLQSRRSGARRASTRP